MHSTKKQNKTKTKSEKLIEKPEKLSQADDAATCARQWTGAIATF
jgi:hypothetical protein